MKKKIIIFFTFDSALYFSSKFLSKLETNFKIKTLKKWLSYKNSSNLLNKEKSPFSINKKIWFEKSEYTVFIRIISSRFKFFKLNSFIFKIKYESTVNKIFSFLKIGIFSSENQ